MIHPVCNIKEVFEGIQNAKVDAKDFRTNFFPVQTRLQAWIDHGELLIFLRVGVTFFFRKDRDFWHFFFCASDLTALQREACTLSEMAPQQMATNLVGIEPFLEDLLIALQRAGFRRYAQLQRMVRMGTHEEFLSNTRNLRVSYAEKSDCPLILRLIENSFDPYAEQPPMSYEIESAIRARQVLVVKVSDNIAGLLFFETQGLTSAVRFWVVDESFRSLHIGSALMLQYFNIHRAVRRFTLWVNSTNANAVRKYTHYGYAPDGLLDYVLLVKEMIPA